MPMHSVFIHAWADFTYINRFPMVQSIATSVWRYGARAIHQKQYNFFREIFCHVYKTIVKFSIISVINVTPSWNFQNLLSSILSISCLNYSPDNLATLTATQILLWLCSSSNCINISFVNSLQTIQYFWSNLTMSASLSNCVWNYTST